jgi:hypothetical protein
VAFQCVFLPFFDFFELERLRNDTLDGCFFLDFFFDDLGMDFARCDLCLVMNVGCLDEVGGWDGNGGCSGIRDEVMRVWKVSDVTIEPLA